MKKKNNIIDYDLEWCTVCMHQYHLQLDGRRVLWILASFRTPNKTGHIQWTIIE